MRQKIAIISIVLLLVIINMPSLALHVKPSDDNLIKVLQKSDTLSAWKDDIRLTNDSADSYRPDVTIDIQNQIHMVWIDNKGGKINIYYKMYNGSNWTTDDVLSTPGGAFPTIATDIQGNIHVAWAQGNISGYEICYTKHNGINWSEPILLTNDSGYSVSWMPQLGPRIVTDSKGYIYIFWTDCSDTYPDGRDIAYVYYNASNWSEKQRATDDHRDEYDHFNPDVAVDSEDNIHLVYTTTEPAGGGYYNFIIHYKKFNGTSWSEEKQIGSGYTGYFIGFPKIATDSKDNLHIVWTDGRDTTADYPYRYEIYYIKLDNNGNALVNDTRLTNSSVQYGCGLQSVTTDSNNDLHLVWLKRPAEHEHEVWYKKLDNNGNTLIDDTYLSTDYFKDYVAMSPPHIAVDSLNRLHIVFGDDRDGNLEIYYKDTYAQDLSISSEDISFSNPYPEPNETIWINASIHNNGEIITNATVKFYDGIVADENLIDTCNVSVPVNDTNNASILWNATAGNHTIWVVVNCTNVIAEANITNNTASKNLLVKSQHPPNAVIDSPKNLEIYLDTDYVYFDAGNSSDLDNDTLSFYWTSNISEYIGNASQFYAMLTIGYHLVTLWVDDNSGHNVSVTVNIIVKENLPPEIKGYEPKTNVTIMESQNQTFTITAEDPNNRTLTYMWYLNDTPLSGENNSSYTFTPEKDYSGDYLIKVIVSDGHFSKNRTWTVTVVNVGQLQSMIEDLEYQLNETIVNNTELQNQLEDIQSLLNSIWNQLNQSLTNNTELENQILMLNQNITSLQSQINQLIQEKENLENERDQAVKDKGDLEVKLIWSIMVSLITGVVVGAAVAFVFLKKKLFRQT